MPKFKLEENKQQIINMRASGMTVKDISKVFNCLPETVSYFLKKNNLPVSRKKYHIDSECFSCIDTEEKAYWLGFLYADGCHTVTNRKKVVVLGLQISDLEILEKFKKFLCTNKPIRVYKNINRAELEISDKIISDSLLKLGCVPRKSLILQFPTREQVPDHLIRHFIRGYFDGDGCLHIRKIKSNWSYIAQLQFIGTKEMISGIKNHLSFLNVTGYLGQRFPERNNNNCHIQFCTSQSLKILDWLYEKSEIKLKRKYEKYIEFKRDRETVGKKSNTKRLQRKTRLDIPGNENKKS